MLKHNLIHPQVVFDELSICDARLYVFGVTIGQYNEPIFDIGGSTLNGVFPM